jgi:gliding motility-associated-like protein
VLIKVLKLPEVPNTFTPNGDGINDVWNIKNLSNYPNPSIQVFNRYGDKVFSSFSADEITWDGRFRGTDLPIGTYYYIVKPGSGRGTISGSVTILK